MKAELAHLGWRLLLATILLSSAQSQELQARGEVDDSVAAIGVAHRLQQAIISGSVRQLLGYIGSQGTVAIDDSYTRKEMEIALSDSTSGMWKYLYGREKSVRAFFREEGEIKIIVWRGGKNLWMIDYYSANRGLSVSCQISKIGRKWQMVSLFSFV
jgi:hypothetical protein